MKIRRILFIVGGALFLFLGMYTWNQRTQVLDGMAANVGLEAVGSVFTLVRKGEDFFAGIWNSYVNLIHVNRENEALKNRVADLESLLAREEENRAEITRLRTLLDLPTTTDWTPIAARVLTGRMGPNSVLESIIVNRGYLTGAIPGTPMLTQQGLVGRILRSGPRTATGLLLTDPGSRIAVRGQKSRISGIFTGRGAHYDPEVRFVDPSPDLHEGEILVTSGLDGIYPRGIPVARVVEAVITDHSRFMQIVAKPLVDARQVEELLLLEHVGALPLHVRQPMQSPHEEVKPPLSDFSPVAP